MTGPREMVRLARGLFTDGPKMLRLFQVLRPVICPFHRLLDAVPPGSRVLDVGCGGGLLLALLAATGRISKGVGFDASSQAVAVARRMSEKLTPGLLEFHARPAEAPWPEGEFDVVTIIDLLHHVPPTGQGNIVRQAAAKVRPGGLVLLKDMTERPLWRVAASVLHDLILAHQRISIPTGSAVLSLAAEAGLTLQSEHIDNMLWYGHHLFVFRKK